VDLTDFPRLRHLVIRDSPILHDVNAAGISQQGHDTVSSVVSGAHTSANEAVTEAASAAKGKTQDQLNELKSHLFQYYSVGLWGYCKSRNGSKTVCSEPSTSFFFDLFSVLNSTLVKVDKVLPGLDQKAISGYRKLSRGIVGFYISGSVTTALVVILGVRKTFFSRGSRLLALLCTVSTLLVTIATVGATVMYGLLAAGIKTALQSFGVQAGLGTQIFTATWLAVSFSVGALVTWLIQLFCCCI
ncbi:hypothetical protein N7476_000295, partial [Penicillium atrosanguineum]